MAAEKENIHLNYIKNHLVPEIISKLNGETLLTYETEHSTGLDGFMSVLYNIRLKTTTSEGTKERLLITKFMRGDNTFRESSKSHVQFANEVFIYAKVLPTYEAILKKANITSISVEDWVPHVYVAKFGYIEGLSPTPTDRECVLALENLKPQGYKLGPRLYLNRDHLLSMCKPLGEYHAMSYALRLQNVPLLESLKKEIITLPFINDNDPSDAKNNLFRVLYRVAFDRFFDFFDRKVDGNTFDKQNPDDIKLIENLRRLREKYFKEPTRLLESLRTKIEENDEDRRFGVILHGDYNRNNVLFQCKEGDEGAVQNIKMIDFQELRYGSPALDVSFFMFMNTPESIRAEIWMEILRKYHKHMFDTLSAVVKSQCKNEEAIDEELQHYTFEKFYAHFKRFAFYGTMICIHFLPWILCNEEECERLSKLFESDMHGEEFRKISIEAGGDDVNMVILNVVRFACKMGYMEHI